MTTRDSRRDWRSGPSEGSSSSGRDPTQSLEVELEEAHSSHPSLAVGTHEGQRDERTKVESPSGRSRPSSRPEPAPARGSGKRPPLIPDRAIDDPAEHLGEVLGSYRVSELLGKGGMGYVYRAEHVKLGREVALKLLRSDYARRRDAVARFFQEARTVNRVRHRNIVDVTDFVELDDGTTFIIMELLSGVSLGKWARSGVDLPRALAVLVQICDGLGAAHSVGVVHRDLKPDNVIVVPTSDGAELVKLLDFGVAKLLNRDDEDVGFQTAAGSVIGTPAYMSPEQAGGMSLDHRSDIYSLGAIMYELFCGQPMFRGRSFGEYVRKHLTELPVPPRQTEAGVGVDPRLEALILRCLEKEPSQRFDSILELRDALLHMLGSMETHPPSFVSTGSGQRAMPTALPLAPIPQAPTPMSQLSAVHPSAIRYHQYNQTPPPTQISQPTPWWVWVFGGIAAVSIGIAAALWYASRADSETPAAVTSQPTPKLTVTQPIEPAVSPKPALVELRFDSLPAGSIYADGRSAELCRTPCAFDVDTKDGDKRKFIVRSEGYKDASVEVDLAGSQREFHVTLERDAEPKPDRAADTQIRPGKDAKRPIHPTGKAGKVAKDAKDAKDARDGKAAPDDKKDDKPADRKPFDDHLMKPEDDKASGEKRPDKKPTDTKPGSDTIDPSETLDPFRRRKPQ